MEITGSDCDSPATEWRDTKAAIPWNPDFCEREFCQKGQHSVKRYSNFRRMLFLT